MAAWIGDGERRPYGSAIARKERRGTVWGGGEVVTGVMDGGRGEAWEAEREVGTRPPKDEAKNRDRMRG